MSALLFPRIEIRGISVDGLSARSSSLHLVASVEMDFSISSRVNVLQIYLATDSSLYHLLGFLVEMVVSVIFLANVVLIQQSIFPLPDFLLLPEI